MDDKHFRAIHSYGTTQGMEQLLMVQGILQV